MSKSFDSDSNFDQDLFNATHVRIIIFKADDGEIIAANAAAQRFYHASEDQILTRSIESIVSIPQDIFSEITDPHRKMPYLPVECCHICQENTQCNTQTFFSPVRFKNHDAVQMCIFNLTPPILQRAFDDSSSINKVILNATHHLIFILDSDCNILDVNRNGASFFGKEPSQLISSNCKELISENDLIKLKSIIDKTIDTNDTIEFQTEINKKPFDCHIAPVLNPQHSETTCLRLSP